MEVKKKPKANLENYSKVFMQLGLVLALFVIYIAIEHKTYERTISDLGESTLVIEEEEDIPITERVEPQKPPPPPPPPTPEVIEVVEDEKEVEETVIESTETDETEVIELEDIVEIEEEEEIEEDVPFSIIENVPVYPGCDKGDNDAKRACLNKKIQKHVNRKFNADLAADLGLAPGKKRIFVMFKIDKAGNVVDIRARAPHKRLEKEAVRVVTLLPKMQPGRQRGKAVGVKYSLPIVFNVE
ncbi:MAG: energy transducer TonB [Flavobacteriaceae bacterium]